MIVKNITLQAPEERTSYVLRFISNNHNQCTYREENGMASLFIGLCDQQPAVFLDGCRAAVQSSLSIRTAEIQGSTLTRYILEDGQTILSITKDGQDSILMQEPHASWRDSNWQDPFLPYWE